MVEKIEGVSSMDSPSVSDCFDATVAVECQGQKPGFDVMAAPCVAIDRFVVNHAFSSNWCHWCGIK